ncbi:MAG: hypothetical protein VKJ27_06320 [Synechocystis sp.]|nr:hypothetical protein [Synechocystis sp.]
MSPLQRRAFRHPLLTANSFSPKLGAVLVKAGLITHGQLNVALYEQSQYEERLGAILAMHGWIAQETVDFFASHLDDELFLDYQRPIGSYFRQAKLLSNEDIEAILSAQERFKLPFGVVAVMQGFLKQETVDFFLAAMCKKFSEISHHRLTKNGIYV